MGADEERIVMQNLGARRLVVGIVQTHQCVPEKRGQLSAGGFQLRLRSWASKDFGEVGSNLQFSVPAAVNNGRPRTLFVSGEDGPGHLEFTEVSGQRQKTVA